MLLIEPEEPVEEFRSSSELPGGGVFPALERDTSYSSPALPACWLLKEDEPDRLSPRVG